MKSGEGEGKGEFGMWNSGWGNLRESIFHEATTHSNEDEKYRSGAGLIITRGRTSPCVDRKYDSISADRPALNRGLFWGGRCSPRTWHPNKLHRKRLVVMVLLHSWHDGSIIASYWRQSPSHSPHPVSGA